MLNPCCRFKDNPGFAGIYSLLRRGFMGVLMKKVISSEAVWRSIREKMLLQESKMTAAIEELKRVAQESSDPRKILAISDTKNRLEFRRAHVIRLMSATPRKGMEIVEEILGNLKSILGLTEFQLAQVGAFIECWNPRYKNEFSTSRDLFYNCDHVARRTVTIGLKVDWGYLECGSGWIHSDNVTVITAAHVLAALSTARTNYKTEGVVVKPYHSSKWLRADVVMVASRKSDVGHLSLPSPYNAGGPPLTIANSDPEVSLPIIAFGTANYPAEILGPEYSGFRGISVEGTMRTGVVTAPSHFPRDMFKLTAKIEDGMVGGPIVDANGTVVGVTSNSQNGIKAHCIVDLINNRGDNIVSTSIPADVAAHRRTKRLFLKGVSHALNRMGMGDLADEIRRR